MGLEDFGVRLTPANQGVTERAIKQTLQNLDFHLCSPQTVYGGARLGELIQDELLFISRTGQGIFEAQVKLERDIQKNTVRYLSLRMAICQPDVALNYFVRLLSTIVLEQELTISVDDQEFNRHQIKDFSIYAKKQVILQKRRWQQIFEGDTEEKVLSPSEAWNYFLEKHRALATSPR